MVAAHAEGVQNGLHFADELEIALRAAPGADLLQRQVCGDARGAGDEALLLVASGARKILSAAGCEPAAHHLHRLALRVKRLHGDRSVGRHLEVGAAVGIHRHGAERAAHVPRAVEADGAVQPALVLESEGVGVEAQVLDRSGRDVFQAGTFVDVSHVDLRGRASGNDAVRLRVRNRRLHERDGLAKIVPRLAQQAQFVVETVDEVYGEVALALVLAGDEERGVVKRIRMQVHGPRAVVELVAHDGIHRLAVARHQLYRALALLRSFRHVEETELPHAPEAVVAGKYRHELRRLAGNRTGVEHAVRPERIAAVERALVRAVRIAGEEDAGVGVRQVGILPPQVHHAAVRHHLRAPCVLLVVAENLHAGAVGVAAEKVRDGRVAPHARHGVLERGAGEHDMPVRHIAGVVVVYVRRVVPRDLAHLARGEIEFQHVPGV